MPSPSSGFYVRYKYLECNGTLWILCEVGFILLHGKERNRRDVQNFNWKTLREELLGRPGRRWEGNTKTELKDIGYEGVDWNYLP
jgi:hypothetical protein